MLNVFLKDIFDKKSVLKYLAVSVILFLITRLFLSDNTSVIGTAASGALLYVVIGLCYSVFFFVRTYIKNDRVLLYYALPVSKRAINKNVILSILIDTILRKMTLACAVMLGLGAGWDVYVKLLFLLPGIVILGCVPNVADISAVKKLAVAGVSVMYGLTIFLLFERKKPIIAISFSVGLCLLYYTFVKFVFMKDALFRLKIRSSFSRYSLSNYFFKFVLAENVYIINTVGIVAMVIMVSLAVPGVMSLCLACALGAVNTPLLTIFSTEKELKDMKNMLPGTFKSLKREYIFILGSYFLLIQGLILILHINVLDVKLIALLLIVTVIEVCGGHYLEERYPIASKKTTTEVWRNPRKYILPILVFMVTFVIQAL